MKRIEGTWFEFWHHNRPEGKYYNAACRSFTRAAKQLFVSHSTTSRAVSALERELGVPLLARDRHTVALTPAGQTLLTGAEDLLRQADALAAAVHTAAAAAPEPQDPPET